MKKRLTELSCISGRQKLGSKTISCSTDIFGSPYIGGIIVFIAVGYLGYLGFQSSATYYYTVSELMEQGSSMHSQNVRVNGLVYPRSVEQEPGSLTLKFTLTEGGR
ncbi:cytochrome c maturation protein CcmE, partial [Chloroflexota bacterium]